MDSRNARPMANALAERVYDVMQETFKASYKRGEEHGGPALPTKPEDMDEIQKFFRYAWVSVGSNPGGVKTWDSALHMKEALIKALEVAVFEALALEPCHVTGMHNPDHHVEKRPGEGGYICDIQMNEALKNFLATLGTKYPGSEHEEATYRPGRDLPRKLHGEKCGWCHRVPSQEEYRVTHRKAYVWADEIPPAELMERGSAR